MRAFLGTWTAVWIHEVLHGLPSYFVIGGWGFGSHGAGIPIALPIGGLFIPNFESWIKYSESTSGLVVLWLVVATFIAPYVIHGPAYVLTRYVLDLEAEDFDDDVGFFKGVWRFLAFPGWSIGIDLGFGAIWLFIALVASIFAVF